MKIFKSKIIHAFFIAALTITILFTLSACVACAPPIERLLSQVSELRENIFIGESASFSVNIITGRREDPFLMDGHAGITRDFTLITITPKGEGSEGTYTYTTTINGTQFKGEFVPHPFAATLSADLHIRANTSEIILIITNSAGVEENISAKSVVTAQMIDSLKALEMAESKLRNSLETFKSGGVLHAEIYIRLLANPIDNSGGFYWYVAFIGTCGTIFAVLIDPIEVQIVAVRN
ncbi:MAG: hypothetical protein FWC82_02835 [Firmicutes bacterium]|nr:hypothetical protein [Bacillota bacterium]